MTNLQKLRKVQNLSRRELSERSGVNLRLLSYYENGYKDINKASFDTIMKLSKVLKCSPEKLYQLPNAEK